MKQLLTALLIISILACFPVMCFASAAEDEPHTSKDNYITDAEYRYIDRRHAEKVDANIKALEQQVQDLAESYRTGTIWQRAREEAGVTKDSEDRALKYMLMAPSYAIRAATWPVALLSDYMIRKGVVHKVVDFVSNDARTFWVYPKAELGFGAGFGLGVGLRHLNLLHKDYDLSASYQIHINLNQEAYASIGKKNAFHLGGKSFDYKLLTGFLRHHDSSYYGKGPTTSKGAHSIYGLNAVTTGGWLAYNLTDHLSLRSNTYIRWNSTAPGRGNTAKVENVFSRPEIPGFDRSLVYLDYGLSLVHDSRDSDVSPERGGLREISVSRLQGLGTLEYDYNEYRLKASQFFRTLMPRHVLALHTAWTFQQTTGDGVPFFYLSRLDVYSPMRGFDFARFSDTASAVFNIEYRYPVWEFMDGEFFFDTGRVFRNPSDFSFKHFKYDGGIGLKLKTKDFFLLRFEVGYGGEGVKFLVKTNQAF